MTSELETWPREHYTGGGGEPFLFYVVYGNVDSSEPLSRNTYRSGGIPAGIDVMAYGPDEHPEVPGSFREGYLWDEFGGSDPDCAALVAECEHCIILRGTPTDVTTLNYLRDTIGLITYLIDHGGCAVYDPLMFRWFDSAAWKEEIFTSAGPVPRHHVVLLVSEEDDPTLKWYHSRGMRKFGRPDISVRHVPRERERGVIELCNRLIDLQAFGLVVPDGHEVMVPSLPPGSVIKQGGHLDDPHFNNVHLDVSWPPH